MNAKEMLKTTRITQNKKLMTGFLNDDDTAQARSTYTTARDEMETRFGVVMGSSLPTELPASDLDDAGNWPFRNLVMSLIQRESMAQECIGRVVRDPAFREDLRVAASYKAGLNPDDTDRDAAERMAVVLAPEGFFLTPDEIAYLASRMADIRDFLAVPQRPAAIGDPIATPNYEYLDGKLWDDFT
jgi:hypothetical protein